MKKMDQKLYNESVSFVGVLVKNWIKENKNKILNYINDNNISNVIISGPPFSLFKLGKIINRKYQSINLILDYRDPWNLWLYKSKRLKKREQSYINQANLVMFTNDSIESKMRKYFNIRCQTKVVANGYDAYQWDKITIDKKQAKDLDNLVISYVGNISLEDNTNNFRNPVKLISAFEKISKELSNIRLKIVGLNHSELNRYQSIVERCNNKLELVPKVNQIESFRIMRQSDVLLIIHTDVGNSGEYLIGGKLYDYIRANRYVLCIGNKSNLQNEMVRKLKLGIEVENDVEQIYDALKKIYQLWDKHKLSLNNSDVSNYSRDCQYKKILSELIE
jgi:glycosyltransferase involved in cell wall biosynthesis